MVTKVIEIDPRELKLLELNARYMRHEEFQRLVANIKKDGQLTSAPFACKDGDAYLVLSGNHRVKAAIAAGLEKIVCIVTDEALSEDQKIGIQLSHNSLVGQDDPYVLKQIYEKILDMDWKEYSGLDDKTLEMLDKVTAQSLSEANLSFSSLNITFLPDELQEARAVIDKALEAAKTADETWIAALSQYDRFLNAQDAVSATYNVKNVATAFELILKMFERNITQLSEVYEEEGKDGTWVPIETLIGRNMIPVGSAKVIKKALDRMVANKDITNKNLWQGLEYLAAEYLGG